MIKALIVALVILIITVLSDRIVIDVDNSKYPNVKISTTVLTFSTNRKSKNGSPLVILKNAKHIYPALRFLIRNSKIFYNFTSKQNQKFVLETSVIILPISLTIFLYSKAKDAIKKWIKNAG